GTVNGGIAPCRQAELHDPVYLAACECDPPVGMNLSRAYSLAYSEELSVGRVQTPTLAMVVERELAIRSFIPEDYIEVVANFRPSDVKDASTYKGTWFRERPDSESMRLPADGKEADAIVARARTGAAAIES